MPDMTKSGVVCAIDVNDFDQNVVDLAATYARHFGVDLQLLHVTLFPDPKLNAWPASIGSSKVVIEDYRKLERITTTVPGVEVVHHHVSGMPADEILRFVEQTEPRLLVMGTHGRTGLARLLGSVASRVMRRAPCPVLILRQNQLQSSATQARVGEKST